MTSYVLALDQGTTSSRAMVFDDQARIVGVHQEEFPQLYPRPGHVEHDPSAIWESQLRAGRRAIEDSGLSAVEIAAIGIANQRETTILWDRNTGEPVANAIVWQSRITEPMCRRLKATGVEPEVRRRTGLVLDPYFSATKVAHLLETVPGLQTRAEQGEVAFGTVDSYLLWKLTGGRVHATDVSNAARTLLFNIHELKWDDRLLEIFGIPRAVLPQVHGNSEVVAVSSSEVLGAEIPICGMAGDQQAAAFGQCCFRAGLAKNTYGTGAFVLLNTGEQVVESQRGLVSTVGWKIGERTSYFLEGSIFTAGAAIQWLRDGLGIIDSAADSERWAAGIESNGGVYLVPAFVGLGAPHWDTQARGILTGLTRGSGKAELCRAALESMAYQTCDALQAMQQDGELDLKVLRVDGGASNNNFAMQFQADMLGVTVQRPVIHETTALGAAYLAGLAVGVWPNMEALESLWKLDREFFANMPKETRDANYAGWQDALRRAMTHK